MSRYTVARDGDTYSVDGLSDALQEIGRAGTLECERTDILATDRYAAAVYTHFRTGERITVTVYYPQNATAASRQRLARVFNSRG